jgi:hypothetical protein
LKTDIQLKLALQTQHFQPHNDAIGLKTCSYALLNSAGNFIDTDIFQSPINIWLYNVLVFPYPQYLRKTFR